MGQRRAIVLGAVHVVILAHVAHWLSRGRTLSPVEPSESMRTLELGELNAGFIFFALAIVSTLIFGRFFCGWGCHIVALQDLCGWMMKKLGVRPRPFRSRLLVYAPLAFALYMFVWPSFRRFALVPAADALAPNLAARLEPHAVVPVLGVAATWLAGIFRPPAELPGFSNHLTTADFWATFPSVWIAVPFLAICGFASVYFLGAKGFCTYGCPYGGFFGLADRFSPGRIRVTSACEGCGHCTAVCTSNVRVHEEVREYGMVVNPGCMKCMDCVSTCPNDALYFGFGPSAAKSGEAERLRARPEESGAPQGKSGSAASRGGPAPLREDTIGTRDGIRESLPATVRSRPAREKGAKVRRSFDLERTEELIVAAMFLAIFFAFRGVYDAVPLLMAIGIAGCLSFFFWKLSRLSRDGSVSIQNVALKREGRLRGAGIVALGLALVFLALTMQSGFVRYARTLAESWDRRVLLSAESVLADSRPPLEEATLEAARQAERHYRLADALGAGGIGLVATPEIAVRRAWLSLVQGKAPEAATHLRRFVERYDADDRTRLDLARVLRLAGSFDEAEEELRLLIARNPSDLASHRELATVFERSGNLEGAVSEFVILKNLAPEDESVRVRLGELLGRLGRFEEAERNP